MRTPNAKYAGRGSLSPSESPVELRRRASERLEAKRRAEAKSRNGNLTMPVIATSEIAAALEAEACCLRRQLIQQQQMPEALNPRRNYSL